MIEVVCMLENLKTLPGTAGILTVQVHLLVHVVDEVAIARVIHSIWMFFIESFMNLTLMGFM